MRTENTQEAQKNNNGYEPLGENNATIRNEKTEWPPLILGGEEVPLPQQLPEDACDISSQTIVSPFVPLNPSPLVSPTLPAVNSSEGAKEKKTDKQVTKIKSPFLFEILPSSSPSPSPLPLSFLQDLCAYEQQLPMQGQGCNNAPTNIPEELQEEKLQKNESVETNISTENAYKEHINKITEEFESTYHLLREAYRNAFGGKLDEQSQNQENLKCSQSNYNNLNNIPNPSDPNSANTTNVTNSLLEKSKDYCLMEVSNNLGKERKEKVNCFEDINLNRVPKSFNESNAVYNINNYLSNNESINNNLFINCLPNSESINNNLLNINNDINFNQNGSNLITNITLEKQQKDALQKLNGMTIVKIFREHFMIEHIPGYLVDKRMRIQKMIVERISQLITNHPLQNEVSPKHFLNMCIDNFSQRKFNLALRDAWILLVFLGLRLKEKPNEGTPDLNLIRQCLYEKIVLLQQSKLEFDKTLNVPLRAFTFFLISLISYINPRYTSPLYLDDLMISIEFLKFFFAAHEDALNALKCNAETCRSSMQKLSAGYSNQKFEDVSDKIKEITTLLVELQKEANSITCQFKFDVNLNIGKSLEGCLTDRRSLYFCPDDYFNIKITIKKGEKRKFEEENREGGKKKNNGALKKIKKTPENLNNNLLENVNTLSGNSEKNNLPNNEILNNNLLNNYSPNNSANFNFFRSYDSNNNLPNSNNDNEKKPQGSGLFQNLGDSLNKSPDYFSPDDTNYSI